MEQKPMIEKLGMIGIILIGIGIFLWGAYATYICGWWD